MRFYVVAIFVLCAVGAAMGHTYHLGSCPDIEPMYGFDMKKMLGLWYVIQKTSTASFCVTYNFTKSDEPNEYDLEQVSQHFILGLTPLEHQYRYTGHITVPDSAVPARMNIRFPLSVAGSASYTVFATDYEQYAAIFTCQKLTFAHRRSVTILSRDKTLDKIYLDKVRAKLTAANIDPFSLSIINQSNCPRPESTEGYNIDIDGETFSAHNVAGVIKKAGEKIGDGVEYVAGGASNAYNSLKKDRESEDISINTERTGRNQQQAPDSEWLP